MLNNQQPTLFESNRRGPLMVHRQPPSWLELAGLACARSGPCEASTCLANQPFCMRNLMGSSNFIPFSIRFPKSITTNINTNIHEATHFIHFHLTLVPSIPLPSPPDNAVISTAKKPCEGCHGFKPPSFSAKKVFLKPRLSIEKNRQIQNISHAGGTLGVRWTLMGCTCLNLRSLHPTRLPNGNMARELSGRSTSCLGFGMAGNSAWRIYGKSQSSKMGEFRNETCLQDNSC